MTPVSQLNQRKYINNLLLRLTQTPRRLANSRQRLMTKIENAESEFKAEYGYGFTYHWQK